MSAIYKEISLGAFTELDCVTLFHEEKTARRFGVITGELMRFKFSWQSDTIDPVLKVWDDGSFCCLGIDQMFSIIRFTENPFSWVVKLDYLLYDIRFIKGGVWVITELEILLIAAACFKIEKRISLPSFFHEIISEFPLVTVECMDGEIISVEVPNIE